MSNYIGLKGNACCKCGRPAAFENAGRMYCQIDDPDYVALAGDHLTARELAETIVSSYVYNVCDCVGSENEDDVEIFRDWMEYVVRYIAASENIKWPLKTASRYPPPPAAPSD